MRVPRGIIPAMLTVFNRDGSIDEKGTRAHAEWLISQGVHGLAPCGSTGEAVAMTYEERRRVIEITVEQAAGRVPIFAGTGHYSTELTLRQSRDAVKAGAESVMVILPYYYQPPIAATMNHLRRVAEAISRPIMVYNNPWFAGFELTPGQIKQLVDEGTVNCVKAAHGDASRVTFLKFLCGDRLSALYGHDYAALEAFAAGGDGWLSALPNLCPDLCVKLWDAITKRSDLAEARATWQRIMPFLYYFMYERKGFPADPHWLAVFKEGLNMLGRAVGQPRLPSEPLSDEERARLRKAMALVYPNVVK